MTEMDANTMQEMIINQFNEISKKFGFKMKTREEILDIHQQLTKYTIFLLSLPSAQQQDDDDGA